MFDLLVQFRLITRPPHPVIFTMLDGNGSVCGPFGNACSPAASTQTHTPRQSRPGSHTPRGKQFVGSVFSSGNATTSGGGGGGGVGGVGSSSGGYQLQGVWHNGSGESYHLSGKLTRSGELEVKKLDKLSDYSLRGAHMSTLASQAHHHTNTNQQQKWLFSPTHLRSSLAPVTHTSSLTSNNTNAALSSHNITQPSHTLRAAATPSHVTPRGVGVSEWHSYLGNTQHVTVGSVTGVVTATVVVNHASSSSDQWWNHSTQSGAAYSGSTARVIGKVTGVSTHPTSTNTSKTKTKCSGVCFYAPPPSTQDQISGEYHSV